MNNILHYAIKLHRTCPFNWDFYECVKNHHEQLNLWESVQETITKSWKRSPPRLVESLGKLNRLRSQKILETCKWKVNYFSFKNIYCLLFRKTWKWKTVFQFYTNWSFLSKLRKYIIVCIADASGILIV